MTDDQQTEYAALYARRVELLGLIAERNNGIKSATLATAGNSQSFTAELGALLSELRAVTERMRQLLGGPSAPFCGMKTSVPTFCP